MSAYDNVDEAYANAKSNITTIAGAQGWSASQREIALADAERAYEANSGALDTAKEYLSQSLGFSSSLVSIGDDVSVAQAKAFWAALYESAKIGWQSFPNGSKAISWLASANGATVSAEAAIEANKTSTIVSGGVSDTLEDYGELASKAGKAAQNPAVWYGVGAAALVGLALYVKVMFRL